MRFFGKSSKVGPAPNEPSAIPHVAQKQKMPKASKGKKPPMKPINEYSERETLQRKILNDALKNF